MSTELVKKRIQFYRQCYLADSRELDINNLTKLADNRWGYIQDEELLASADMPIIALSPTLGEALNTQQQIYQRELQLIYGVLPICGRYTIANGTTLTLCSPVIYYEAKLEAIPEESSYFLQLDLQQPVINRRLLRILLKEDNNSILESCPLPQAGIDSIYLSDLINWLTQHTVLKDTLQAVAFPHLESAAKTNKAISAKQLSLRSATIVALTERGAGSRGISHELQQLQIAEKYSTPLRQLLGEQITANRPTTPPKSSPEALPTLLSRSQLKALANAASFPLSFIAGPPGTGKSYTIAALALDRFINGESVLLITRNKQAATVLADKLKKDMGISEGIVESNQVTFMQSMRTRLDQLLRNQLPVIDPEEMAQHYQALTDLLAKEKNLQELFAKRCQRALFNSQLINQQELGQLSFWRRVFQLPFIHKTIRNSIHHWQILDELNNSQKLREHYSCQYINNQRISSLRDILASNRPLFVQYNQAIRARQSQQQLSLFTEINTDLLLKAFPIWIVTLDELHKFLPLKQGLFDVMVMDEANQCDIASALPALQRAKRAVIVGDGQQLRHLSFLSRAQEKNFLEQATLPEQENEIYSYREFSVLDLAEQQLQSQNAVTFLDEHFRSRPSLIRFSNRYFYNNLLKVMKERPILEESEQDLHCLKLERIAGQRHKQGYNELEALRVIEHLQKHIAHYQHSQLKPTVGVLSPFRDQVDYIREQLTKIKLNLQDFNVLIDTPYGFQGEERDLMIISFAIDDQPSQAARYLNRHDVFNVAITRAKEQQIILFSGNEQQLPTNHLLRNYLEDLQYPQSNAIAELPLDDFQQQISNALQQHQIKTWSNYPIAGQLLDILCQRNDKILAIDLIGYPGISQNYFELERYQILRRAGLAMIPISYGIWKLEPELVLNTLLERLT